MVTSKQHAEELAKAGIFSPGDLETNRRGHLSDRQERLIHTRLIFWLGCVCLYFVLLLGFIYFQVSQQRDFLFGLAGITYVLFLISSCLQKARAYWEDLHDDVLRSAAGRLHKFYGISSGYHRGSQVGYLHIRVKDELFPAPAVTYHRVSENYLYRIYYVENTRTIVNIEPL